jgi:hypothetical protein
MQFNRPFNIFIGVGNIGHAQADFILIRIL